MARVLTHRDAVSGGSSRTRVLLVIAAVVVVALLAVVVAALAWSGVASDSTALAHVTVQPLGGTI